MNSSLRVCPAQLQQKEECSTHKRLRARKKKNIISLLRILQEIVVTKKHFKGSSAENLRHVYTCVKTMQWDTIILYHRSESSWCLFFHLHQDQVDAGNSPHVPWVLNWANTKAISRVGWYSSQAQGYQGLLVWDRSPPGNNWEKVSTMNLIRGTRN